MALRGKDLDRLGAGARRQIDAFRIAEKARDELLRVQAPGPRKTKYGNKPVEIDGRRFASTAEGNRYLELRRREAIGLIRELECQPRFPLVVGGIKCAVYIADFSYLDGSGLVVEDVKGGEGGKGTMTAVAKLKIKLVKALHGIDVRIIAT